MGCSSCSTAATTGTPAGCRSNGTCGTSGCNKLNVYNWLSDMVLPLGQKPFDIVEVRFKGSRKEYFRNINSLDIHVGDTVAVEGNPGHDIGEISMVGELVRFQLRKRGLKEDGPEIKQLYRVARDTDIEKFNEVKALEFDTMHGSRKAAISLGLKMKISDVEYQGDGKKATFFYTAEERVDFRELIKRLADQFKVRIEMRQIGMRQEAARLGGIGSCGRELCCSTWLTDFKVVSTSAARYQNLSLNPIKLAGQCGKLKCCLNYELDSYMDAVKDIPESNIKLQTGKGTMVHRKTDIFKRIMWYAVLPEFKPGEDRPFAGAEQWIPMSVERVNEIIALNKSGQRPEDVGALEFEDDEEELGYDDVVGQDSLTRMDRKKKKKKKKKKPGDEGKIPVEDQKSTAQTGGAQPARQLPKDQQSGKSQTGPQQNRRDGRPAQNQGQKAQQGSQHRSPQQKPQGQPAPRKDQSESRPQAQPKPQPQPTRPANSPQQSPGGRPPRQAPGGQPDSPKDANERAQQNPPTSSSGNRPPRRAPGSDTPTA